MAVRNVRQVCVTNEIWNRFVARIEELDPIGSVPAVQQNALVSAALLHFSSLARVEALRCLGRLYIREGLTRENRKPPPPPEPRIARRQDNG